MQLRCASHFKWDSSLGGPSLIVANTFSSSIGYFPGRNRVKSVFFRKAKALSQPALLAGYCLANSSLLIGSAGLAGNPLSHSILLYHCSAFFSVRLPPAWAWTVKSAKEAIGSRRVRDSLAHNFFMINLIGDFCFISYKRPFCRLDPE